jgi:hypothetical protein
VWLDVAIDQKDFSMMNNLMAPTLQTECECTAATLQELAVRGMPRHHVGAIQTMDVEVAVGEALRCNFSSEELDSLLATIPCASLPAEVRDQVDVLDVLLHAQHREADIHAALETLRVSSAGILFHLRYQPKGQSLKKDRLSDMQCNVECGSVVAGMSTRAVCCRVCRLYGSSR